MNSNRLFIIFISLFSMIILSCFSQESHTKKDQEKPVVINVIAPFDTTIVDRFPAPESCERIEVESSSFGHYLRNLELKDINETVKYYDGGVKPNYGVYCSVIDLSLGNRDLQHCADAVMRLRAEYLFHSERQNEIKFDFLSDGKPRYYSDYHKGDLSYAKFLKYMDWIFAYANTRSLHGELIKVEDSQDMQIGDVFIQTGKPYGHAVIVVDMAIDNNSGQKYFMLAQSYMPAQDIQILNNPNSSSLSPWYKIQNGSLITPEWNFEFSDLRRFP